MVRRPTVVRPFSVHHFQRSSPKPLGQSKPNFIWSLSGTRERKFVRGVWVTWPSWPPRSYMIKTFKNLLIQNQRANDLVAWYVALKPWAHHIYSNDDPRLTFTYFTARSNLVSYSFICFFIFVRKSLNGRNLQQMARVTKGLCLYKNSDPKGLSAPAPGLYICLKAWKIIFLKLATNGQSDKAFLLTLGFCPQRVVWPCYIHVEKY